MRSFVALLLTIFPGGWLMNDLRNAVAVVSVAGALTSPLCTKGATATRRKQMIAARKAAMVCTRARVVGVAFFDFLHGQTGVARNGIELHPVLGFACLSKLGPPQPPLPPLPGGGKCAASYPTVCIHPPPPDLNCSDVPYRNFRVCWDVADPNPHRFDGDHDGVGCET
jgi:hypothetical protein